MVKIWIVMKKIMLLSGIYKKNITNIYSNENIFFYIFDVSFIFNIKF